MICAAAHGGDVYRWVDDSGRVQYGDSVPGTQKRKAKAVDTANATLTDTQRREAEARLPQEKALTETYLRKRENAKAANEAKPIAALAPKPGAPLPIAAPSPPTSWLSDKKRACEAEWRRFEESHACFAPFRLANGGIKAEAFQHCTEVKMPLPCA